MKINSQAMISKLACRYRVVQFNDRSRSVLASVRSVVDYSRLVTVFLFMCSAIEGSTQEYTKTFTNEIVSSDELTVSTNVPSSLEILIDGANAHRSNTYNGYIIKGSNNKDRLYINKDYVIETWGKNIVRQEVDVTIRSRNKEITRDLLDQLKIKLYTNSEGHITIDANMNLMKFAMSSRLFREDDCQVTLDNGSTYSIDYLEIKTRLFIPRKSNLKVNSILHHTLRLGELEGDLDLNIQYGEVYGKRIHNLNANLRFCFNVIFEEANNVIASATNSHLKISKVNQVHLGKNRLEKGPLVNEDKIQWLDNNSSMNLYNFRNAGEVVIHDTANDDFTIGAIDDLKVISSIYSNYKILKLNNELLFDGKNGDLSIAEVNRDFDSIEIRNKLSKLNLNIADDGNYSINIIDQETLESKMPIAARLQNGEDKSRLIYRMGKGNPTGEISIQCDRCELDIW